MRFSGHNKAISKATGKKCALYAALASVLAISACSNTNNAKLAVSSASVPVAGLSPQAGLQGPQLQTSGEANVLSLTDAGSRKTEPSIPQASLATNPTSNANTAKSANTVTAGLGSVPEAHISDRTKFSSAAYGVKGSPRMTRSSKVRKGGGRYQVGKPYTIRGKRYVPRDNPNYKAVGLASWYGPNFHGRLTANGEIYDQNALSAAHPTLPLPSIVKVTNLENGASVHVRVNDRGPYSKGRIIDLSARAANLLGYTKKGVAKVQVQYVGKARMDGLDEKQLLATYRQGGARPVQLASYQAPVSVPKRAKPAVVAQKPKPVVQPAKQPVALADIGTLRETISTPPQNVNSGLVAPPKRPQVPVGTNTDTNDVKIDSGRFGAEMTQALLASLSNGTSDKLVQDDVAAQDDEVGRAVIGPVKADASLDDLRELLLQFGPVNLVSLIPEGEFLYLTYAPEEQDEIIREVEKNNYAFKKL